MLSIVHPFNLKTQARIWEDNIWDGLRSTAENLIHLLRLSFSVLFLILGFFLALFIAERLGGSVLLLLLVLGVLGYYLSSKRSIKSNSPSGNGGG
jgi:VIT1/CCC1 family predicted Fe2+/Mn2+ transporter